MASVFLSARWQYLAMLNYRIDPGLLTRHVPAGTELELWQGDALVSVVGFRFLDTRVRGLAIPFHRDFDEINLRLYVTRRVDGEVRRGVVFIREIVPRLAIAAAARVAYNEPYIARPMRSMVPGKAHDGGTMAVEYGFRHAGGWNTLCLRVSGAPTLPPGGSEAEFITEHYWGYTRQRDGSTIEYEVQHPPWRVWTATEAALQFDVARVYGEEFVVALTAAPCSAFLAEGSEVTVMRPVRLTPRRGQR